VARDDRRHAVIGLAGLLAALGCRAERSPVESPARPSTEAQETAGEAPSGADTVAAPPRTEEGAPPEGRVPAPLPREPGVACGALGCLRFDSPAAAFASLVAREPRVLAIGESHALAAAPGVESATQRFSTELLPWLEGRASALVVELLLPDPRCRAAAEHVREEQKVVTEQQAAGNQNEFVTLGHRARALGIEPFPLRPDCDTLARIAGAGPDTVLEMLTAITRLTEATVKRLLARDAEAGRDGMVVAYGGAMHNDLSPRPGREAWSFGPALSAHVKGRYLEVDLIVPEYIKDTEAWRALPWYSAYDPDRHGRHTVLFNPGEGSYVLIFARSGAHSGAPGVAP
jgi:hypothetical protein